MRKDVCNGASLTNNSYLSDGTKVSATNDAGDGFFYAGSLVYRKAGDRLTLESAGFDGGRFVVTNTGVEPRYFESDHLGSTRVVVNAGGEVLERNDYYILPQQNEPQQTNIRKAKGDRSLEKIIL